MVRRYAATDVRRRQIAAAARRLIVAGGAEHVTVRRIAKEVGLSEAAIYRHFKSKKDVLFFLTDEIERSLIGDVTRTKAPANDPLGGLDMVLRGHLSAIERRRGISFQIIAEIISLGDRRLNRRAFDIIGKYVSSLQQLLSECAAAGQIRTGVDLEATATMLFCMIQGLANMWALSNYDFDPVARYERLWGTFRESMTTDGSSPATELPDQAATARRGHRGVAKASKEVQAAAVLMQH